MKSNSVSCIFCGKSRAESAKIIISGEQAICDKCISLFSGLIKKSKETSHNSSVTEIKKTENSLLQLDSIKIKEALDKLVIGQEDAKKVLSVSIVNHYKRMLYGGDIELEKSNVIITGPSGSGKSLLVDTIAKFLNVPFISVDATTLTEAGYIGENVDTIITKLLIAADGNIKNAEQGIVFIDEIDKISTAKKSHSATGEAKASGIQSALLKLVEKSLVRVSLPPNPKKISMPQMVEVNTKNILFICGGAFVGLNEIVTERLKKKKSLGFSNPIAISNSTINLSKNYTTEDFISFGMIPEFIGRFPSKTSTTELSIDELIGVLTILDNNVLTEIKFYFEVDNINIEFTEGFIQGVANRAYLEKTGVRGLRSICESIFVNHLYRLPEYKSRNISKMIFDSECLEPNAIPKFEIYENCSKLTS